jgi:hypothetical protein
MNYRWFGVKHLRPLLRINPKGYIVPIYLFVYNTKVHIYRVKSKYMVIPIFYYN